MTEFDLAVDFLQAFAAVAVIAADAGLPLDDCREFRRYCRRRGLEATAERLELMQDVGAVFAAHLVEEDAAEAAGEGATTVTAETLLDGLERLGWRLRFLARPVTGAPA